MPEARTSQHCLLFCQHSFQKLVSGTNRPSLAIHIKQYQQYAIIFCALDKYLHYLAESMSGFPKTFKLMPVDQKGVLEARKAKRKVQQEHSFVFSKIHLDLPWNQEDNAQGRFQRLRPTICDNPQPSIFYPVAFTTHFAKSHPPLARPIPLLGWKCPNRRSQPPTKPNERGGDDQRLQCDVTPKMQKVFYGFLYVFFLKAGVLCCFFKAFPWLFSLVFLLYALFYGCFHWSFLRFLIFSYGFLCFFYDFPVFSMGFCQRQKLNANISPFFRHRVTRRKSKNPPSASPAPAVVFNTGRLSVGREVVWKKTYNKNCL